MDIYDKGSSAKISILDCLRSDERGDLVQVVGLGEKVRHNQLLPLVQLQQVGNPLSLYDATTHIDENGRWVIAGYEKDAL